ncbi:class II fructose-bisphosphate aldolase [Candidatus Shapirobacteria bacterium]|nr:class II fructose-bisphosphate aldolase [Candidatus Shapirobacteria bacterium]
MIPLKQLLLEYQQKHWALPAFNIDSFEIYQAVETAVLETNLPCIVQLSPGEEAFVHSDRLLMLVKKANADSLPIYLNMDHGININNLETAIRLGFDMVHFDGSKMDYQTNLAATKYFIDKVKTINPEILIEAEFNHINLIDTLPSPDSFTDPLKAQEFMTATGADLFAVSIGNLHGVNTNIPEHINISLLSQIKEKLGNTPLTLHGGSGISPDQVKSAINLGVVKININTDLRLRFIESLRHQLTIQSSEKVYEYLTPVVNDLKETIKQKLINFTQNV